MKTIKFLIIALIATLAVSCSKKSETISPSSLSVSEQKSIVSASSWRINYFTERGVDQTSDYSGYQFAFNSNGSVTVTASAGSFTGSWNLSQSNAKPDDSGNHTIAENKMNILVAGNKHMDNLSKNWKIVKLNSTEIWLADDNPASAEEVHFGK